MADVRYVQATKLYAGSDTAAVDALDLTVEDAEFMVLVGPSGSGKTTALRMLAGLEEVDAGAVLIGGRDVTDLPPKRRDVAMVFQNYALYPYLTVAQNIAFPLKMAKVKKAETSRRVEEVAQLLGLDDLLERRPAQLSGGQRQRVAMGRAIVREPKAFLMDEPLSNLDAKLRVGMRASLAQLHARLGVTTVYVTHDQTEAMTLGQRVAVMRHGKILQVDPPHRLYEEPVDLFVAAFIGSPAMNLVEATIDGDEIAVGQYRVPLDRERRPPPGTPSRVILGIRPESFGDAAFAGGDVSRIDVEVTVLEDLGADAHIFFPVEARRITPEDVVETAGDEVTLLAEERVLFNARVDPRTRARTGARAELTIDPTRFHFFDPASGRSLLAKRATAPPPTSDAVAAAGVAP